MSCVISLLLHHQVFQAWLCLGAPARLQHGPEWGLPEPDHWSAVRRDPLSQLCGLHLQPLWQTVGCKQPQQLAFQWLWHHTVTRRCFNGINFDSCCTHLILYDSFTARLRIITQIKLLFCTAMDYDLKRDVILGNLCWTYELYEFFFLMIDRSFLQFSQLISNQKRLGSDTFPLIDQTFYPNYRDMVRSVLMSAQRVCALHPTTAAALLS